MACKQQPNKKKVTTTKFDSFTFGVTIHEHSTPKSPQIQIYFKVYAASFYMKFFKFLSHMALVYTQCRAPHKKGIPQQERKSVITALERESHVW